MKKYLVLLSVPLIILAGAQLIIAGSSYYAPTHILSPIPSSTKSYKNWIRVVTDTPTPTVEPYWVATDSAQLCTDEESQEIIPCATTETPTESPTATPTATITATPFLTPTPQQSASSEVTGASQNKNDTSLTNDTTSHKTVVCDTKKPGDILNLAVDISNISNGKITLSWKPDTRAHTVNIRYSEEDNNWRYALRDYPNDGHVEIGGLLYGTHYYFQMQNIDGCAFGNWSRSIDP